MLHSPRLQPLRLADFHQPAPTDLLLRDWLHANHDALFRWTMAMASGDGARRLVAQTAVSVQRLRGAAAFQAWLFGTAVQAAAQQGDALPEASLSGLPPELRALLRLVAHGGLQRADAQALLDRRMGAVRQWLLQARLTPALAEHQTN